MLRAFKAVLYATSTVLVMVVGVAFLSAIFEFFGNLSPEYGKQGFALLVLTAALAAFIYSMLED